MHRPDFEPFRAQLNALAGIFGKKPPDDLQVQAYWNALRDLPLELVEQGVRHHIRYGKFFPKPVELRPKDERPGGGPVHDTAFRAAAENAKRNASANLASHDRLTRAKAQDALLTARLIGMDEQHRRTPRRSGRGSRRATSTSRRSRDAGERSSLQRGSRGTPEDLSRPRAAAIRAPRPLARDVRLPALRRQQSRHGPHLPRPVPLRRLEARSDDGSKIPQNLGCFDTAEEARERCQAHAEGRYQPPGARCTDHDPVDRTAPKVSQEHYARLLEVRAARQRMRESLATFRELRASLPTNADLAREAGVSVQTIANVMERGIKRYDARRAQEEQA